MTSLTATRYMCHKWPRICPVCRYHNSVLFSFMTYHRVCSKSSTRSATYGTGTAYLSLFVLLSFFFLSLYMHCLALRDLRLLITPNVVSVLTQPSKIIYTMFCFISPPNTSCISYYIIQMKPLLNMLTTNAAGCIVIAKTKILRIYQIHHKISIQRPDLDTTWHEVNSQQ
jgi:hypothetical protein